MITKKYTYNCTLATIGGYQNITLYTRNTKEISIIYDYGAFIKHIRYKNANEAVEDFYKKILFFNKYTKAVNLTLAGSNFIMKGGIL